MPDTTDRPTKLGTIQRLIPDGAYGFIYCQTDNRDYFFHRDELVDLNFRDLESGDRVTFLIGPGKKGKLQAEQIRRIERIAEARGQA
jgi:cold shock CspA family protein